MSKTRPTTRLDIVLTLTFAALVSLPLVGGTLGWDLTHELGEKRTLAEAPVLGEDRLETIPEKFEAYYQDHFGFRNGLIQGHNWIRYKLFKGSSFGKVLFGKDDWLFLTKSGILPDFLGQTPLTPAELQAWTNTLQQRQQWLGERGIRYLFVIAPNKATIYPEMLPDHIQRGRGRSRMDQLIDYLRDHSTVHFIDLRPALLQAKSTGVIYHPKDSHWTDRGAVVAYQQICQKLGSWFPEIRALSEDDFEITTGKEATDLSMMLGLGQELAREAELWVPKTPPQTTRSRLEIPGQYEWNRSIVPEDQVAVENAEAKHRLLLFHDSFAARGGLRERLSLHFRRSAFTSIQPEQRFLELLVEQEKPDIVIEEMVERKLKDTPPAL